jgi:hypothetical protein
MSCFCSNIDYSMNRRDFLGRFGLGLGGVALMNLLHGAPSALAKPDALASGLHHQPRAKRIIYLFMAGGPASTTSSTTSPC